MSDPKFKVDDRVRVINPSSKHAGKEGVIDTINKAGTPSYKVKFDSGNSAWAWETSLKLIPHTKFVVGDMVTVREKTVYPENSTASWVRDMDYSIGKTLTVVRVYDNGNVQLQDSFVYPATSLHKAKPAPKPATPEFQVGDSVEIIAQGSVFRAHWGTITEKFGTNLRVSIPRDDGPPYSLLYNPEELKLVSKAIPAPPPAVVPPTPKVGDVVRVTREGSHWEHLTAKVLEYDASTDLFNLEFDNGDVYLFEFGEVELVTPATSFTGTPIINQENDMSSVDSKVAVQKVTFIYGVDAANLSDGDIFDKIRGLENSIEHLKGIKNKPEKLKVEIKAKEAEIAELVKFVDER